MADRVPVALQRRASVGGGEEEARSSRAAAPRSRAGRTHLERLHEREHLEFGPEEHFGVLAPPQALVDDAHDPLAHAVPQVLDVLLRAERVGRAQDVRLDEEEADDLLEEGREGGERVGRERGGR